MVTPADEWPWRRDDEAGGRVVDVTRSAAPVVTVHHPVDDRFAHGGLGQVGQLELLSSGEVHGRAVEPCLDEVERPLKRRQQGCAESSLARSAPAGVRRWT